MITITKETFKTIQYTITFGINEGYFHENEKLIENDISKEIGTVLQNLLLETMKETEVYPSGVLQTTKCIYNTEWGCPTGGEDTFTMMGSANPKFVNLEIYKKAVIHFAELIKKEFKQTTITIEFKDVEMVYLFE
ncbi:hypothetical protein [Methanococcus voltae]|uniref:Uncharacterized protein n=1 Tax=Methanococcus voltae TaxID=2188 RepID=A0A8J7UU12_METVO|nr:hypothetical protein [Methanococcus voltae]MBP2173272.1 hypothetical protein [Methanococcus voltae]MBP2202238.1 hypothetical protein [Methanococcus voltae]